VLAPGMKADIAILDLTEPSFVPLNSVARQLVYAESGEGVKTVIIDGRVVMKERRLTTIDEAALREEIADIMTSFRPEARQVIERNEKISEYILEADRRIWEHDVGAHRYIGR
jgi:5-methylthioadenosine/S-adenosylhomocysteine deaminase